METKTYVAIDQNNHCLASGKFCSPAEAIEEAKGAPEYSPTVKIFILEVTKEYVFKPEREGSQR